MRSDWLADLDAADIARSCFPLPLLVWVIEFRLGRDLPHPACLMETKMSELARVVEILRLVI